MHTRHQLIDFVTESNKIEGIVRNPTNQEIDELERFLAIKDMEIDELIKFVSVYEPNARMRDTYGLNVRVGSYYPPFGGPEIRAELDDILKREYDAYELHCAYESLHPFTDCNGRSGRALWAWKHRKLELGFLHSFYYQTLNHWRK